jgi:hypothetical protein
MKGGTTEKEKDRGKRTMGIGDRRMTLHVKGIP